MTNFQAHGAASVQAILGRNGVAVEFTTVECGDDPALKTVKGDVFLRSTFDYAGRKLDIYIYPDEAGFFVDSEWRIFEAPDYDTADELLSAFVGALEQEMAKG